MGPSDENDQRILRPLATMKDREFQRLSTLIYAEAGIKMPPAKKTMLEARLQKRIKKIGQPSFEAYTDYLFSSEGRSAELIHLIDAVTTNKTDFFREPAHFEFLVKQAIPSLSTNRIYNQLNPLRVWSAGCSTGEEPYTISMVLAEYAAVQHGFRFTITASDICTQVLQKAMAGIYAEERTDTIPLHMKKKYLLKSRDRSRSLIRIIPDLRGTVQFKRINFMEDQFDITGQLDIIFCRNVVIYFDRDTQETLMRKFYKLLRPGGFLFIGHSETLNGIDVPFKSVASTIYRKP
jgi:chemotaxis protein methyltransferase CheR